MRPLVLACAVACAGCGRPDALGAADATGADAFVFCSDQLVLQPTFTNVQRLFSNSCVGCHTQHVPLDLRPSVSYGNLIGVVPPNYGTPPTDESCGGVLVEAGGPAASYLYQKVSSTLPCAGSRMPLDDLGFPAPLLACEQALIHDWIAAGAPND